MKRPKYIIDLSVNRQYYFKLVAPNGKVLMTSETYLTHEGCRNGIRSTRINAVIARVVDGTGGDD